MSFGHPPPGAGFSDHIHGGGFDPRVTVQDQGHEHEELYTPTDHIFSETDKALFGIRISIIIFFLINFGLVIWDVVRENLRIKCSKLYLIVSGILFVWLALSLYQDHIDEYYVHEIERIPQKRSIYWCFRNLFHGFTLYLVILLLSQLAEFQHRNWWIYIVFGVILTPLVYSVAILIIDLVLDPEVRLSVGCNVAIDTVRIILYNIVTSVISLAFYRRFCTRRKYGTYSDTRNPSSVLISRWAFIFLILHNLTAIASYGAVIHSRASTMPGALERSIVVHRWLEECLLLLIVLCIPVSYVIAMFCHKLCFGDDDNIDEETEMNKVDDLYQQVWSTNAQPGSMPPSRPQQQQQRGHSTAIDGAAVSTNPNVVKGGVSSRPEHGSRSTLGSIDFTLAQPSSSSANGSTNGLAAEAAAAAAALVAAKMKKKHRESYMEAVSSGSVDELPIPPQQPPRDGRASRASRSSDPIDL